MVHVFETVTKEYKKRTSEMRGRSWLAIWDFFRKCMKVGEKLDVLTSEDVKDGYIDKLAATMEMGISPEQG